MALLPKRIPEASDDRPKSNASPRIIALFCILFALALIFPAFGYLAPFAIAMFALIASIVVIVSAIHWVFADDRRAVLVLAWEFVRSILIATALAVIYWAYAWMTYEVKMG